jgi:GPH family glycoside/pentoside/hexuronide:cation symporter
VTLGSTTIWSVLDGWLLYFYLPPDGEGAPLVPAVLSGVVIFLTRAINAVIGPPIGYLSDHARNRWGRRLPFMFVSALPMLAFFTLLWTPPVQGKSMWNLVYLAVVMLFYNTAYSLNQIPYSALLPEVALTERHRVRISAWYAGFQLVGVILAGFAGLVIERRGYTFAALIYASAMLPFFYLPFITLRERPGRQIAGTKRLNFRRSVSITLHNRSFLTYTAAWALYWSTMVFVQALIPYITTEICLLSEADTLFFYVPAVLASLACYPLITWLSERLGKRRVYTASLLASAVVLPCLALIGDWLPAPLMIQGISWVVRGSYYRQQ